MNKKKYDDTNNIEAFKMAEHSKHTALEAIGGNFVSNSSIYSH